MKKKTFPCCYPLNSLISFLGLSIQFQNITTMTPNIVTHMWVKWPIYGVLDPNMGQMTHIWFCIYCFLNIFSHQYYFTKTLLLIVLNWFGWYWENSKTQIEIFGNFIKTQELKNSNWRFWIFFLNIKNSRTRKLKNSKTQKLKNSRTQKLKNSKTQIENFEFFWNFKNSKTRKLENSRTQKLKKSNWKFWIFFLNLKNSRTNLLSLP